MPEAVTVVVVVTGGSVIVLRIVLTLVEITVSVMISVMNEVGPSTVVSTV